MPLSRMVSSTTSGLLGERRGALNSCNCPPLSDNWRSLYLREFAMLTKGSPFAPQPPEPQGAPQTTDQNSTQAPSKTPPNTPPLSPATLDYQAGSDEPPLPQFGRYELLEKLGGGGMGLVFRAIDTQLNRQVALKTIREGVFADGQEIGRFRTEAQAVAKLHHPNIIAIYDIGN